MKDHAWLATANEVKAMLAGRLTMFYRPMKPQPIYVSAEANPDPDSRGWGWLKKPRCPYGVPGDRLCVKETWRECGSAQMASGEPIPNMGRYEVAYRTDEPWDDKSRWRPSTNMPRWASRLTREVVVVRTPLLQSISMMDAIHSGIKWEAIETWMNRDYREVAVPHEAKIIPIFREFWDSTYGKRPGLDWASNPRVWAVTVQEPSE